MGLVLDVADLTFGYSKIPILRDICLPTMRSGRITAIVGPNAAGKSTLLKCIAGIHRAAGTVRLTDTATHTTCTLSTNKRLRRSRGRESLLTNVLYTPQDPPPAVSISVFEAVLLARQGQLQGRPSKVVLDQVASVLSELHLDQLSARPMSDLSGGQRQLLSIAQAMIRKPAVMLLDEPTSNLDMRNQLQLLERVHVLAREQPAIVVVTVHDLGLAARFADDVVVLHRGSVHSAGPARATITEAMLREVYRVGASVQTTPDGVISVAATHSL